MSLRAISIVLSVLIAPLAIAETSEPSAEPAPAKTAIERPALQSRSAADAMALERQLAAQEQQQLSTQHDEKFLALWRPANTAAANGSIILIPGDEQNADWPVVIGPLRRKLPDAGWNSLSLTLPDPFIATPAPDTTARPAAEPAETTEKTADNSPEATLSPAEATADPAELASAEASGDTPADGDGDGDTANADLAAQQKAYAQRIFARIESAISFAQQQNAKKITLLGNGTGAYWAARFLAEQQPQNLRSLILVSVQQPIGQAPDLASLLSELTLATGDFYYNDQTAERDAAKQRLQAAKRQQHTAYIQIGMNALPGDRATEQEQLNRRIRGWLSLDPQSARP